MKIAGACGAKETSELISANIEKAELGLGIARETTSTLTEIIAGIDNLAKSMDVLARQGQDNRAGTTQVIGAMEQVSMVTQQNSATSEESAAASQEMHQYADSTQRLVGQFQLDEDARGPHRPRLEQ